MKSFDLSLMDLMFEDMSKQKEVYRPTTFWEEGSKVIVKEIKEQGVENFRSLKTTRGFFVPNYSYSEYYENENLYNETKVELKKATSDAKSNTRFDFLLSGKLQAFSDYRVLKGSNIESSPYTSKVSESNVGQPLEQFNFDNRNFSRSFLNYLLGLNFLKKHVDSSTIKNVMEIGGGFGTLGEILLGDERNDIFYINADIPPVSFVSSYYLKEVFGKENIADYGDLHKEEVLEIDKLKQSYKAVNLCSWQIEKLKGKIDLFVNFISFQEMEPDVVNNYCKYIRDLAPQFILLRNIQEGKKKRDEDTIYGVETPILGDDYDSFLPEYELKANDSEIFGFKTEDNFHSQLRLYVRK
ncbi:putative sugar O-methyltransferase [Arcobacter roscoffensis]|uniref:Sugar O-methyltransferase n=1 Tax=Arcobacter roscoffensis TaxID=2961520 RepID=A0ABY5E6H7_9BACT|nr:putative sugar O-methyltransferase [Arcobacter roscoffensis]UTJ06365.1 putative sugar O-methyltransferase [Arcobacter roscoffensis]